MGSGAGGASVSGGPIADALRNASSGGETVRLRARWVLPIHLPPIENGEVAIENGVIVSVGRASGRPAVDLGLAALLPGFVNTHAHLEHTVLRGLLEDIAFLSWMRALANAKTHLTLEDWTASATLGAAEMLAAGVTTVADVSEAGASLGALIASGQRGIVYREVSGMEREPSPETVVQILSGKIAAMRAQVARTQSDERVDVGVSPHSLYAVRPELFAAVAFFARREGLMQTIHVAESPAEEELMRTGEGAIRDNFRKRGIAWETPGVSSTRYIADAGGFDAPTLAVHCVHTDLSDAQLLKEKGVSVAHCPKSNGKQGAGIAPARTLLEAGLAVGLGTDSATSNNAADMFEEMRLAVFGARSQRQDVRALSTREALEMATLGGAAALGKEKEIGSLAIGKRADLCAVRLDGLHVFPTCEDNPVAALVYAARASDVSLTIVGGRVVYENGHCALLDVGRLRRSVGEARAKLRRETAKNVGAA